MSQQQMISKIPGGPWAMIAVAILVAAILAAVLTDRISNESTRTNFEFSGPERGKSQIREKDFESNATRKKATDPKLVKQRLEELLERHPEARPEKRDVPDHENGHLAWVKFSGEVMEGIELPDCLSHYVTDPTIENLKCAAEWLSRHKHIGETLVGIGALRQQSMGDHRFDKSSKPGVKNIHKAFYMLLASGLIALEDDNEALARSTFASAMGLVRQMEGVEASSLIERVIATGSRTVIYKTFLERIYPSIVGNTATLSAWRDALSPGDTRDGLTRAFIGSNLRDSSLLISSSLSGDSNPITGSDVTDAETELLIDAQFEVNAKVIAALKAGSLIGSIPTIYGQSMNKGGLSGENLAFFTEYMETMREVATGVLKKETRLMMYDAALAAAMGEEIPIDPISGKPFQWNEATMTLSAPEGTLQQEPIILSTDH